MNGPPSSGQQVITGGSSRRTSVVTTSTTGPATRRDPDPEQLAADVARAPQLAGVGGSSVSARCTSRLISCSGRVPNASSARRGGPEQVRRQPERRRP